MHNITISAMSFEESPIKGGPSRDGKCGGVGNDTPEWSVADARDDLSFETLEAPLKATRPQAELHHPKVLLLPQYFGWVKR